MALRSQEFVANPRIRAAAENSPPMRKNESGSAVALVQKALIRAGFSMPLSTANGSKPPDGVYGDETVKTVWAFQNKHNLQRDGEVGRITLQRLDEIYSNGAMNDQAVSAALEFISVAKRTLQDPSTGKLFGSDYAGYRLQVNELDRGFTTLGLFPKAPAQNYSGLGFLPASFPNRQDPEASFAPVSPALLLLLAAAATAYAIGAVGAMPRPKLPPPPKLEPKPNVPTLLEQTTSLAMQMAATTAATMLTIVIGQQAKVDQCKNDSEPERREHCSNAIAKFDNAAAELRKKLVRLKGTTGLRPAPDLINAANKLLEDYKEALAELNKCLGCKQN
jgi:peptidoglycan hydrolase-like protein with peptidoglycan-binding domain